MLLHFSFINVYGNLIIGVNMDKEKIEFDDLSLKENNKKETKYITELPAGLLSMLFMGISLSLLPVFLTIVKMNKESNNYNLMHTFGIVCLIIDFILLILQIMIPMRLFLNYQKFRSKQIQSINTICVLSVAVIIITIVLGFIFIM